MALPAIHGQYSRSLFIIRRHVPGNVLGNLLVMCKIGMQLHMLSICLIDFQRVLQLYSNKVR